MSELFPLAEIKTPGLPYTMSQTCDYAEKSNFPADVKTHEAAVSRRARIRKMYKTFILAIDTQERREAFINQMNAYKKEGLQLFDTTGYKLHISLERTEENFKRIIACLENVMKQERFQDLEFKYKLINISNRLADTLRSGAELTIYIPANTQFEDSDKALACWSDFIEAVTQAAHKAGVKPHPRGTTTTDKAINHYFSYRLGNNGANLEQLNRVVLLDPAGKPMTQTDSTGQQHWVKGAYFDARETGSFNPLGLDDPFERFLNKETPVCASYLPSRATLKQRWRFEENNNDNKRLRGTTLEPRQGK